MWIIRPLEITRDGGPSGRWSLTATSDEDGGGPFGDPSHDHGTAEEADACERCDEYCARISGFPSKKQAALDLERHERAELERLKKKYEIPVPITNGSDGTVKYT